jgi:hypothetical protein
MIRDLVSLIDSSQGGTAKALDRLWKQVRSLLPPEDDQALGSVRVGSAGWDETPWAHTNDGEERVNLTLEVRPDHLELNLVGWNEAQSVTLKAWLQSVAGEIAVNELPEYQVVAFVRRAYKKTPTSSPWWQDESVDELGVCPASEFTAGWIFKQVIGLGNKKEEKPAFHVRRAWPIAEAEALGEGLPQTRLSLRVDRMRS